MHCLTNLPEPVGSFVMPEGQLFLVSGNKSRIGNLDWFDDDYDVRDGAPDGPVVGRIYKLTVAPTGNWWFWAVQLFPAVAADSGTAETREAAMDAFKAQWMRWRDPWIRRP
jgi:hypothetical protein